MASRPSLHGSSVVTSAAYIGRERVDAVSFANRGLNYGDGVFETMRLHQGTLPLWPRHLARLREGAARLGIAMPDAGCIEAGRGSLKGRRGAGGHDTERTLCCAACAAADRRVQQQ